MSRLRHSHSNAYQTGYHHGRQGRLAKFNGKDWRGYLKGYKAGELKRKQDQEDKMIEEMWQHRPSMP